MTKMLLLGMILGMGLLALGQTPAPKDIHEKGCVRQGVEAGCLTVITLDGKTTYNILIAKNPPKAGDVIEFWGKEYMGVTICMEGKAVKVDKWTLLKMKCPLPPSPGR
jgi:hypothetical protein